MQLKLREYLVICCMLILAFSLGLDVGFKAGKVDVNADAYPALQKLIVKGSGENGADLPLYCKGGDCNLSSSGENSPNIVGNTGSIVTEVESYENCHIDVRTCSDGKKFRDHILNRKLDQWPGSVEDCHPIPRAAKQDPLTKNWFDEEMIGDRDCPAGYFGPFPFQNQH